MPQYQDYSWGKPKTSFRIRLDDELLDDVRDIAKRRDHSLARTVSDLLADGVDRERKARGKKKARRAS